MPPLTKAYLDLNIWEYSLKVWDDGSAFAEAAHRAGFQLCLGTHVVYELARRFGYPDKVPTAQRICRFLLDMGKDVEYLRPLRQLIAAEVGMAVTGDPFEDVLSEENVLAYRKELGRLEKGHSNDALAFIGKREDGIQVGYPKIADGNRRRSKDYFKAHPQERREAKTFEGYKRVCNHFALLGQLFPGLPKILLERVLSKPQDYPVLTSSLNANLYMAFIAGMHRGKPRKDRIDDYRHVIESTQADVFVTGEKKYVPKDQGGNGHYAQLVPGGVCVGWDEFRDRLQSEDR